MIHKDLPFKAYQEIDAINISALKEMRRSPAHFYAKWQEPNTESPELLFGSLIHCLILEPDKLEESFLITPKIDKRTAAGKAMAQNNAEKASKLGLMLLDEETYREAEKIASRASESPYFKLLKATTSEVELSLTWELGGVECKGRIDHYDPKTKTITDIKTTKDASIDSFAKTIFNFGYHNQAAWYIDGAKANGLEVEDYIIFAVEKETPYAVAVYRLNEADIELARLENERWLRLYQQGKVNKQWKAYPEEIQNISLPSWAIAQTDRYLNDIIGE